MSASTAPSAFVEDYSTGANLEISAVTKDDLAKIEKAEARADRLAKLGRKCLGPIKPEYFDAYMTIRPLLVRLTSMSTRGAYRSFKMISQLQRVCHIPYLPASVANFGARGPKSKSIYSAKGLPEGTQKTRLLSLDDAWRSGLLRNCAILSSAVYPSASVMCHGVRKCKDTTKWRSVKYRIEHLMKGVEVVDAVEDENVCQPAYAVCINKKAKILYVVVRGSSSAEDFVTNMMCDPADGDLGPHRGMYLSAEYLDTRVRKRAISFIESTPQAQIVLTGHSLGAGAAALLCTRWLRDETMTAVTLRLQCIALACPAIFNERDSYADNPQIKVIVFGKDIVPRLSFGSFRDLLVQMSALAKLEARSLTGVESASVALSDMSRSTADTADDSGSSTPTSATGDDEWKCLPERTDDAASYKSLSNVILTDVSFAGLTAEERAEQNRALAAQMKASEIQFGGASFNQINSILKRRIRDLDKTRRKVMRYPSQAKLLAGKSGLRVRLLKIVYRLTKLFYCCTKSTEKIAVEDVSEEDQLLQQCLREIYELRCKTSFRFFTPPGQIYLCVPKLHFIEQKTTPPKTKKCIQGQCYIFELDREEFVESSLTPVWSVGALHQHRMQCYLQALAPDMIEKFPLEALSIESAS